MSAFVTLARTGGQWTGLPDWRTMDRPSRLADNGKAYQTGGQLGVSAVFVRQATLGIDQQVAMIYANIAGTVLGSTRVQNDRKYRYRY